MQLTDIADDHGWRNSSFGPTAQYMKETGLHTWGFVVYRTSYGNDDGWARYLEYLHKNIHEDLVFNGSDKLLEQYAEWTIVEDKDLEGATTEQVRSRFLQWRDEHSVSRMNPSFSELSAESLRLPRFTYCLYVDEKCIKTLQPHVDAMITKEQVGWGKVSPLAVVIIDANYDSSTAPAGYPGWVYFAARYLATFYDEAHDEPLSKRDYMFPPKIGPAGRQTIPQ